MSDEWDLHAPGWDSDPAARAYATAAFSSLLELLSASARSLDGANVMDFGCGTGLLTEKLVAAGATVEAVDTSHAMLEVLTAKVEQHGWTRVRPGAELPHESPPFDLVVCSSVCSFLDDFPSTVEELVSRLVPGGVFVQWDWERTDEDEHGLTRDQIRSALASAGLVDIDVHIGFTVDVDGLTMSPLIGHGRRPLRDDLELLIDLHLDAERQGPGSNEITRRAITLSGLSEVTELRIADIGCGTGASTVVLAHDLDAHITAVDLVPAFLARLGDTAQRHGLADRITTVAASMDDLAFDDESLDAIWSEGAIYNIGFEHGVRTWRRFLKPGGILAVSELTWLTQHRPAELHDHWINEYSEVDTASAKIAVLETAGYAPIGYFPLPEPCWLDHYYHPMQQRFPAFLDRHRHSQAANDIVESEQHEIDLYERHAALVGYGYYLARRTPY